MEKKMTVKSNNPETMVVHDLDQALAVAATTAQPMVKAA
jgi:hypothetical protein